VTPKIDYLEHINRAIDHVLARIDSPLSLEHVAKVAGFSPFHFHRVFRLLVGETLAHFVKRVRLERALAMLSHRPDRSLTEVAIACGFASSSDFSRSFKQRYGVPPSAFDVEVFRERRREDFVEALTEPSTRHLLQRLPAGENPDGFAVTMRSLPPRWVAYIRVHRPYEGTGVVDAVHRLVAWAEARDCVDGQWLGYTWDDPDIVPMEKCRYDVGVEIAERIAADGEVGCSRFPAMKVAELSIAGAIDVEQRALDWLFGTWLPGSGLAPDEQPCFEAWNGRPFAHGFEHFELRLHLPVREGGLL
jgi:AraC family transcriptional regulator